MASSLVFRTAIFFLIQTGTLAFRVDSRISSSHKNITHTAILQIVTDVCRKQAQLMGKDFVLPDHLTTDSLAKACSSSESVKAFRSAIDEITHGNTNVDPQHASMEYHFDDESFLQGQNLITAGVTSVKASLRQGNFQVARQHLGEVLHTLQDFYSHSNWIELGNIEPYSNLIRPGSLIDNIADKNTPTCKSCIGNDCQNNILDSIISQKKLTSGYYSSSGSSKPNGKCSHGGASDRTSRVEPAGGISKDYVDSSHGFLHHQAAAVATTATIELLEDIMGAAGDINFLRLMGISQSTSILCFVIDTTGSMEDEIEQIRNVTSSIIDQRIGTANEPSLYILVPFNDPEFGPMQRTTDPDEIKQKIKSVTEEVEGGGDPPEMCLSALQLALTGAPPETDIFVLTDAEAKDTELKGTVLALIESTKSKVNFLLTNALISRRRRRSSGGEKGHHANPLNQLYRELAEASGGLAIEVTKKTLPQATSIIVDASNSARVTLLHAVRNPGRPDDFSFLTDSSVRNLKIYMTGYSLTFTITSPSGKSQSNGVSNGDLGVINKVGNFYTVTLNGHNQTGLWKICMNSTQPYTVKVTGQSEIDFLFYFVELFKEPHPGYAVLDSRPPINSNVNLLVSVTGGDSVRVTEVALVDASDSGAVNGTLEDLGSGDYLVTMSKVPAGQFVVSVKGERNFTKSLPDRFQRQSTTQIRASSVFIATQVNGTWEPGTAVSVAFTVSTGGSVGSLTIRARNNRGFDTTFPQSLITDSEGRAKGIITLTAPSDTPTGTDVTLTIEADAPGDSDTNYAVLRLAVVAPVTDVTPPVCEITSINAHCSVNCSLSTWELSANLTDGNGTGIQSLTMRQGNGNLTNTTVHEGGVDVILASYIASCCSQDVKLVAVDKVGNVGTCVGSIRGAVTASTSMSSPMPTNAITEYTTRSTATAQPKANSLSLKATVLRTLQLIARTPAYAVVPAMAPSSPLAPEDMGAAVFLWSERHIDSLIHTTRIYSNDIGMSFGLEKCGRMSAVSRTTFEKRLKTYLFRGTLTFSSN
ncbi:von Willebrand factor A domain-containing protein 7-like [Chanos chanos]|uniref:von Willebrand factor A domain-containing protein 7-like n=1 Tax=Chanos chanos TaxID=29144 RepID=A0A6J2WJ42_CHACN|nr:von Willebrand factor A domain-containing protein 7-like [Chanos chanos]